MPKRAILFDVDGTILDANQSIRQTMNHVLAEQGQRTFTKAELDALIGHPLRDILRTKAPNLAPEALERMALRYREVYNESGWVTAAPFAGIESLLRALRADGHAIGIVTSKGEQEAETVLFDVGLGDLVDTVVGDDDKRPLKPDPAPVLEACRRLNVPVASSCMIGDTRFDIESARRAGSLAIGVLWGNGSRDSLVQAGAQKLVADVPELLADLRAWAAS